mgnify:FL=1
MGRLSNYKDLLIDWDMTPEEAVTLYLEWGNNWRRDRTPVRSKNDQSFYFIVDTWENEPQVRLVKMNSEGANELAALALPRSFQKDFLHSIGHQRGVYPITKDIQQWLEAELYN